MRRALPAVMIALSLAAIAPAIASAETSGGTGSTPSEPHQYRALNGTIVSVDPAAQTITIDVHQVLTNDPSASPPNGSSPPPTHNVTVATDPNTKLRLDRQPTTLGALQAGDGVTAYFSSPPGSTLDQALASPAISVVASTLAATSPPVPPEPHPVFIGKVVSVDAAGGSITADVRPASSHESTRDESSSSEPQRVTILTDANTKFRLNGAASSLSGLAPGDYFAALYVVTSGETTDQILASPAAGINAYTPPPPAPPPTRHAALSGTIVSVDTAASTITADVRAQESHGLHTRPSTQLPAVQRVTILTDANTKFRLDGASSSLAALAPGNEFVAYYVVGEGETLDQMLASPALGVAARTTRAFYGFAGTVTGVDATASTVTITVLASSPAAKSLLGQATSVTLKVGPQTFLVGKGGLLSDLGSVHVGDLAAGGLVTAPAGSLADVLAQPLDVLVDVPAGSIPAGARVRAARATLARVRDRASGAHGKTAAQHGKRHKQGSRSRHHKARAGKH